jgi:hypothetical protein
VRVSAITRSLAAALLGLALQAAAQPIDAPSTDPAASMPATAGMAADRPTLEAVLVDRDKKAAKREATVQAKASGINIVDPAVAGEKPKRGEGHFHYQVDGGPIVATTAAKLSFHELSPGPHIITVILAGNDHRRLIEPVVLQLRVP